MTIDELNQRFGIDGTVAFGAGPGGLTNMSITAGGGEAEIMVHGAHVTHFRPAGAEPVLWMSRKSRFAAGRPIRGGVPVCFPWFGSTGPRPDSPHHGFARLMGWEVESTQRLGDGRVAARLLLRASDATGAQWPGEFELRHTVTVGSTLTMSLEARNVGREAFAITEALHSYFAVSDVRNVSVHGLGGAEYVERIISPHRVRQGDEPIRFARETDRAYLDTTADCVLDDPGMGRKIRIAKSGSASTVVWNPWIDKAARMDDFADDEWPSMVCIETANALSNAVTIEPGGLQTMEARISII